MGKCYITSVTQSQSHDRKVTVSHHMIGHIIGVRRKCTDYVVVV